MKWTVCIISSLLAAACARPHELSQQEFNAKWGIVKSPTGRWQPTGGSEEGPGGAEAVLAAKKYVDANDAKSSWIVDTEYFVKKHDAGYLVNLTDILGYNSNGLPVTIPDAGLKLIVDTNMIVKEVLGHPFLLESLAHGPGRDKGRSFNNGVHDSLDPRRVSAS